MPLKHEFLNGDNSGTAPVLVPQQTTQQGDSTSPKLEGSSRFIKEDTFWLWDDEFRMNPQGLSRNSANSNPRLSLQEMMNAGHPVTDLFPETSSYDNMDIEYSGESLSAGRQYIVNLRDAPIRPEFMAPLLNDLKTQIQQKLESKKLEAMLER